MEEIWKDIEGYEGYYQVSSMGRVRSLNYRRASKERVLKQFYIGQGYLFVNLWKDCKAKPYFVHRLVASAFCENQMGYTEVNHKDKDKTNNCAENLEWCSRSYNCNYGTRNERIGKKPVEKLRNNPKISKPVIAIHKVNGLILEFPSIMEASRQLSIDSSHISACCKGKRKSIGGFYWHYVNDDKEVDHE